jgi:hypothetical protein
MLMATPADARILVNASLVNCTPWSLLKICGRSYWASACRSVSTQNREFSVLETDHARRYREN